LEGKLVVGTKLDETKIKQLNKNIKSDTKGERVALGVFD